MEAEGIETDGILRVVLPPPPVGDTLHGLQGMVIVLRHAARQNQPGGTLRLKGADVGGLSVVRDRLAGVREEHCVAVVSARLQAADGVVLLGHRVMVRSPGGAVERTDLLPQHRPP